MGFVSTADYDLESDAALVTEVLEMLNSDALVDEGDVKDVVGTSTTDHMNVECERQRTPSHSAIDSLDEETILDISSSYTSCEKFYPLNIKTPFDDHGSDFSRQLILSCQRKLPASTETSPFVESKTVMLVWNS